MFGRSTNIGARRRGTSKSPAFVQRSETKGHPNKKGQKNMLKKRIIVCLDVKDGRTTKGVKFKNNVDIGDPVEMAKKYYEQGVDELVFYDIMASANGRGPILDLISRVAEQVFIPFCVGGGIGSLEDIRSTILAGAEKVSLNSQAVKNPDLITQGARIFGNQCIVLGMDAAKDETCPSGYRVYINGGRVKTDLDAREWAIKAVKLGAGEMSGYRVYINGGRVKTDLDAREWAIKAVKLGAGEIVLNSIDADGMKTGYEINLTKMIAESVGVPVIASGGGGTSAHLADVLTNGKADAALVASMVHSMGYTVGGIKTDLSKLGVPVRM